MPTFTDTEFELDTDCGLISMAQATFQYRETYSRGDDFVGPDIEEVELIDLRIGGLHLSRYQVEEMISQAGLAAIEANVSERLFEMQRSGDLEAVA